MGFRFFVAVFWVNLKKPLKTQFTKGFFLLLNLFLNSQKSFLNFSLVSQKHIDKTKLPILLVKLREMNTKHLERPPIC